MFSAVGRALGLALLGVSRGRCVLQQRRGGGGLCRSLLLAGDVLCSCSLWPVVVVVVGCPALALPRCSALSLFGPSSDRLSEQKRPVLVADCRLSSLSLRV